MGQPNANFKLMYSKLLRTIVSDLLFPAPVRFSVSRGTGGQQGQTFLGARNDNIGHMDKFLTN